MTDDELLASALRKILTSGAYVEFGDYTRPWLTIDGHWTDRDGLTQDEMAAMRRAAASERRAS